MESITDLLDKAKDDVVNIEAKAETFFEGASHVLQTVVLPTAIAVGKALNAVVVADGSDYIGSLAGAAGDAVENEVRAVLPGVVSKMQLAQTFLTTNDTNGLIAEAVTIADAAIPESNVKEKFIEEFTVQVAQDFAANHGINLTLSEVWALVKMFLNYSSGIVDPATIAANAIMLKGKAGEEATGGL